MRLTSLALALAIAAKAQGGTVQVYILAGQSNAVGFASAEGLSPSLQDQPGVMYRPITGPFTTLQPIEGRFGPELSFGRTMQYLSHGEDIAIIKYARGSTSLAADWAAGGLEYTKLLTRVHSSLGYLQSIGLTPKLAGFVWMQGEEDAWHQEMAVDYEANLRDFITRVRTELGPVPFSVGRINAPFREYRETVRSAQEAVSLTVDDVDLVNTDYFPLQDKVHYSPDGQIALGKQFAFSLARDHLGVDVAPYRVVPEPSTGVLAALAGLVSWISRKVR